MWFTLDPKIAVTSEDQDYMVDLTEKTKKIWSSYGLFGPDYFTVHRTDGGFGPMSSHVDGICSAAAFATVLIYLTDGGAGT
jgi:hypothetical protein